MAPIAAGLRPQPLRASGRPLAVEGEHRLVTVALVGGPPPRWRGERLAGTGGAVRVGVDRVVAIVALAVTAPLFLAVVLALRLTGPGPLLAPHPGTGRGGQAVRLLRFRTERGGGAWAGTVPRLLAATGLDRLPHLLNLARGDVSLFPAGRD